MKYCTCNLKKSVAIWYMALFFALFFLTCTVVSADAATACPEFTRISTGGFGDPQNNYAWSVSEFRGDLYVGTGRNVPYLVSLAMKKQGVFPENMTVSALTHPGGAPPPQFLLPNQSPPSREDVITWSNDMRPEIWRYHGGSWSRVHQASTFINPLNGYTYPEGIGYRIMTTFNDTGGTDALYAGVGFGFGRVLIVKSTDGVTWVPVNTSSIPSRDTRAMASYNGKLYVGTADGVFASASPSPYADTWQKVAGFQVASLKSFNGHLYVGTGNPNGPSETNGFEVWRSNVDSPTGPGDWTRVVQGGAGDAWNVLAASMQDYKGDLYVGSMNLPFATGTGGLKGFDLIRLNRSDSWDLIVGNYHPKIPTEPRGPPLSGWPSGFVNPFNLYAWSIGEYNGELYLGTFDIFSFARFIGDIPGGYDMLIEAVTSMESPGAGSVTPETGVLTSGLGELKHMNPGYGNGTYLIPIIELLGREFGGADLWTSKDGVHWVPLELNGFGDPNNYGFRTMLTTGDGFIIGTANPFTGCQVWRRSTPENPPASITNLHNVSFRQDSVKWAWTDPGSPDLSHVMVFIDGAFRENVTRGRETYTASPLNPDTSYVISTRTVGMTGLVNETWVNSTARTAPDVKAWKFRSDLHNTGIYDDGGERPESGLRWNYSTGAPVDSSPAIVGGVVYFGSPNNSVYALDAVTGTKLWIFTTDGEVRSSPAVTGGIVYVGSEFGSISEQVYQGNLYALDGATGAKIWNFSTNAGIRSSPAIVDGVVYFGCYNDHVYALNATTGAEIWNSPGVYAQSSPAVSNGTVYIGGGEVSVNALNATDGSERWSFPTGNFMDCSPAVANGVVYIGSWDKNIYALNETTGTEIWHYTTGSLVTSSPAVSNGTVYVGGQDNKLYALDAATGAFKWSYTTGSYIFSSPAVANGVVYIGSFDHKVYALNADSGVLEWSYTTGGQVFSSPAVSNGTVYIGSKDGKVYAIGSTPENPPESISGLNNVSFQPDYITWAWTDSGSVNFDHVEVYLDGVFMDNVARGLQAYNATLLSPDSEHILSTRTVSTTGLVNETWVNSMARTAPPAPTFLADFTVSPVTGTAPFTIQCTDQSIGNPTYWNYDLGDGTYMTGPNPVHTYRFPGVYTINLSIMKYNTTTHSMMGSTTTKPGIVTVSSVPVNLPVAQFAASPVSGAAPLNVAFTDLSTGNPTYLIYDFGDGLNATGANPVHIYRFPGVYNVTQSVFKVDSTSGSVLSNSSVQNGLIVANGI